MKRVILFGGLMSLAVGLGAVASIPSWREYAQSYFGRAGHDVLATAEGDALNDGSISKVVKYRGDDGIYVEVLRATPNGETTLVDRVLLPDKHDGLFNYQGHVTRLAIADIDDDGKQEILAPTFDNQLVPHLNVFRYNPDTGHIEPYQPPAK